MKITTIRYGKYTGEHYIWDNDTEFYNTFPNHTIKKWGDTTITYNDWVRSDDGYIIQCLHIATLTNKKSQQHTYLFRFPIRTMCYYETKKKGLMVPYFYLVENYRTRTRLAVTDPRDKKFVLYYKSGMSMDDAYKEAFGKPARTQRKMAMAIERNSGELMKVMQERLATIDEQVKTITGNTVAEIIDQKLVTAAVSLYTTTDIKEIREGVKFFKWYADIAKKELNNKEDEEVPPLLE